MISATIKREHKRLCDDWGLQTGLQYNGRLGRLVLARYRPSIDTIEIGQMPDDYGRDALLDIIRHEISHALDWHRNNGADHSPRWRALARLVGCHPRATSTMEQRVKAVQGQC